MAINLQVSMNPNPIAGVIGQNTTIKLIFSNLGTTPAYNLSIQATLPDGTSFVSSSVAPTSTLPGTNNAIVITWTNLKDLAPNEQNYTITLTLSSNAYFRSDGTAVPFDTPLPTPVVLIGSVNPVPDGSGIPITQTVNAPFTPLRYSLTKTASSHKIPKGAGFVSGDHAEIWPYTYTLTLINNSRETSQITLNDVLPNGVKYLGITQTSGLNALSFLNPIVTIPNPGTSCSNTTLIDWGTVILSLSSINTITFKVAIWNQYTVNCIENSGNIIPHGTALTNTATLTGLSGPIIATDTVAAMDAIIVKTVNSSTTDVTNFINYTLTYEINQYAAISNFTVIDTFSDGQTYQTASLTPTIVDNPDYTTTLTWSLGQQNTGTTGVITFSTHVNSTYGNGTPVVAYDTLNNTVAISGINIVTLTPTPDTSSTFVMIISPIITKRTLAYYDSSGNLKPSPAAAAPGDQVKFEINYSSLGIIAIQHTVTIDDFAPSNMGPLTTVLPITYTSSFSPSYQTLTTISPNGLSWLLGDVPGNSTWTATFTISVFELGTIGSANNLAKLASYNSEGLSQSDRSQSPVVLGSPQIAMSKSISPDTTTLIPGQIYTYAITITNPQTGQNTTTDAYFMDFTDPLPTGMIFSGNLAATGTGVFTTPIYTGTSVTMTINHLAPNETVTVHYDVTVNNQAAGSSITNTASLTQPFTQLNKSYQLPGADMTTSITRDVEGLVLTKSATPTTGSIGDTLSYTISFTVPLGTTAYNPYVIDHLPPGQTYVTNSAKLLITPPGGIPASVTPTFASQILTFPTLTSISATTSDVIVTYTFTTRITSTPHVPPYSQTQNNTTSVFWALTEGGIHTQQSDATFTITATTPNITVVKEQLNTSVGGSYTKNPLNIFATDIIYYRLTVTSNGASPAYTIILTDTLSTSAQYLGLVSNPLGTATYTAPTLTWTIDTLPNGSTTSLIFAVDYHTGPSPGSTFTNNALGTYNTSLTNPTTYTVTSNAVQVTLANLLINKVASPTRLNVGDTVTYSLYITLPVGTTIYDVLVYDTLPTGQIYAGNAKRNFYPVSPNVSGQTVYFPQEAVLGPFTTQKTILYSFNAQVVSISGGTPPISQVNQGLIHWSTTSGGPIQGPLTSSATVLVSPALPYRGLSLEDVDELLSDHDWK